MAARRLAAVCAALCATTIWAAGMNDVSKKMLEQLQPVLQEAEAQALFKPHLDNVKTLDNAVMEKVIARQWWELARELVAASHAQKVDLSFSVRKAVRSLKDESDELLRTLNPKYGQAQHVSPAFQWAQNDSCIFLTVKFTVRWNAPGALEVTEPMVDMSANSFNFTGLGKHSNNKYKYTLGLSMFDNIVEGQSVWSTASVGKLSVTLRKLWARKWPRLLADKKMKIGNMHVWHEQQERLDGKMNGLQTVTSSPITCGAQQKLYCLSTDTCKKAVNCSQCPGKTIAKEETHLCTGVPGEKASIAFEDADMDEHEISGRVNITNAKNEFDIDQYVLYFGRSSTERLGPEETLDFEFEADIDKSGASELGLAIGEHRLGKEITRVEAGGLVETWNAQKKKGTTTIQAGDVIVGINGVAGSEGIMQEVKKPEVLRIKLQRMVKAQAGNYVKVGEIVPTGDNTEIKIPANTRLPDRASHLLLYSVNEYGEYGTPDSVSLTDVVLPKEKPPMVSFEDEDGDRGELSGTVTVGRAGDEKHLDKYSVHWGRSATRKIASSSLIQDIEKRDPPKEGEYSKPMTHYIAKNTKIPNGTTHILVFAKNSHGENSHPASVKLVDNTKPCLQKEDQDCVLGVTVSPDEDADAGQVKASISIEKASTEASITHYVLYYGRKGCEGGGQSGAKNGHIKDLAVGDDLKFDLQEDTALPHGTTHILVFPRNKYGESDHCQASAFADNKPTQDKKEL